MTKNTNKNSVPGELTIEEKFITLLSPKRFRTSTTPKKDYPNPDFSPFESDYDRVATSASIRRLQDKTQIFPQEKSDFVRRRLTHSIEVAAVGRRIGLIIENRLIKKDKEAWKKYIEEYDHAIPTILETAGLVHDIGNPPFGHFGEKSISDFFNMLKQNNPNSNACPDNFAKAAKEFKNMSKAKQNDFVHFDGNVQGFRILRKLGLSPDNNSFNLTMPTLATIIKYPLSSNEVNTDNDATHASTKSGYYQSEKKDYNKICKKLHLQKKQRHPLVYLLEAADDIANVTSDVEDGYKMGLISIDEIFSLTDKIAKSYPKIDKNALLEKIAKKCNNNIQATGDFNPDILIQEFRIQAKALLIEEAVNMFINSNNFMAIINAAFDGQGNTTADIIDNELLRDSLLRKELTNLQRKTFDSKDVMKSELLGRKVIMELLSRFIGCMFSSDVEKDRKGIYTIKPKTEAYKLYSLISDNYKQIFKCKNNQVPKSKYDRFLLAVDYVSGMTDSFAIDLYKELTYG